jgi:cysteinyl-tRNA synthetase
VDETDSGHTLDDLIRMGYSGRLIRYWLLTTHYRKSITFSKDRLINARHSLKRLDQCIHTLKHIRDGRSHPDLNQLIYDIKQGFIRAMDDDLNISAAMAVLFGSVKKINILKRDKKIDAEGSSKVLDVFRSINTVLELLEFDDDVENPTIEKLIKARDQARSEQNWELADRIRNQLRESGIIVQDDKL